MKKRILVLTGAFPPSGGSGTLRILKFVKYLNHFGWCCYVMSADLDSRNDPTLITEIPASTRIYRRKNNIQGSSIGYRINEKPSSIRKVLNKLCSWFCIPDRNIFSIFFIFPLGKNIISRFNIRVVFVSIPPFSLAVASVLLKRWTGAKLVLDFRDPWAESYLYGWSAFKRQIQKLIEKWSVNSSDIVITNTKELEDVFKRKYPDKKIVTINNGYDTADFPINVRSYSRIDGPLTIVHTGEFYPKIRNPKPLLIALGELCKEGKIDKSSLLIQFFGGGELVEEDEFLCLTARYNLYDILKVPEFIPHKQAIEEMMRSDVLLLMQNSPKAFLQIPAKAFEYLYLKKPILSLSPEGATSNLIRETDSGFVVNPENIVLLKEKLLELIELKKKGQLQNTFSFRNIERFDRKYSTSKLTDILNSLI